MSANHYESNKEPDGTYSADVAIHIAFTSPGLKELGLPDEILSTFSREFLEGMTEEYRSMLLGDTQQNSPEKWGWGNAKNPIHCMMLYYAKNENILSTILENQKQEFATYGLRCLSTLDTFETPFSKEKVFKEHFGFRDGISTPIMEGLSGSKKAENNKNKPIIKAGEFLLGYKNEYGVFPDSPSVKESKDPKNILPDMIGHPGFKDLGKNGTYLVYRQIEQHVFDFWQYMYNNSGENGSTQIEKAIRLAAKMVGRWPGGAPLAISDTDDPDKSLTTDFSYQELDPLGHRCPFGSHVRRTNPRDMLRSERTTGQAIQMVRKHQILRRGRVYGKPLVEDMSPEKMINLGQNDDKKRGLHFICLVGDISRQFEFIQNVWANNFTFADLCNEVDPLISPRPAEKEPFCNEFTVPDEPLRRNYKEIPQFTKVVGGAYFFLPGVKALEFLANV